MRSTTIRIISLATVFLALFSSPASACSIFVSADAKQVYFCNNEDYHKAL